MDSKKFSIITLIVAVIMCVASIAISLTNGGKDGIDGKSAYEQAVDNGYTGTVTEWLKSLNGSDGESVELEDLYNAYLSENNLTTTEYTYSEFITEYFSNLVADSEETTSLTELATQSALRSTVDILYSFYLNDPIIYVSSGTLNSTGEQVYIIDENNNERYASIGVSAGSGVIYKMDNDTAYIITNYHVVYANNYTNDSDYRVYYNSSTNEYFTATYDESMIKTTTTGSWWGGISNARYIQASSIEEAPIYTHFLDTYEIYLNGYQSAEYAISATFVGGSADNDIAVLKVEKDASPNNEIMFNGNYKAADIGDSSNLAVGEGILAVGNPLLADTSSVSDEQNVDEYVNDIKNSYVDALCLTSTDGVVSNLSEYCNFESIIDSSKVVKLRLIRVSSAINAGNSGGGLYDLNGRLVGIVNGKIESASYDNVGYAIPINIASRLADKIIAECDDDKIETTQVKIVDDESLGLTLLVSTRNAVYDSNDLTWKVTNSVIVEDVSPLSLAENAGIKVGDVIESVTINGIVYELNYDYELNDLLLKVIYNSSDNYSIKFNISRTENESLTNLDITLNLTNSNFVSIN